MITRQSYAAQNWGGTRKAWKNVKTVLAEFWGGFTVFLKYFGSFTVFGHTLQSQGGHSAHTHTGGQSKKFSGNPKVSLQLHCNPKISAHFILGNLYMNIKYPETMQIEMRIASGEPRNISLTIFDAKNIMNIISVLFEPKNITFGNILT